MRKMLWLLCVLLLAFPAYAQGGKIPKAKLLAAIQQYKADPLSPEGEKMGAALALHSEQADDISIVIDAKSCPFVDDKDKDKDFGATMLTAYVVGNMEPQVQTGLSANHSYEGVVWMLEVYQKYQALHPSKKSRGLDDLIKKRDSGKLKAYIGNPK